MRSWTLTERTAYFKRAAWVRAALLGNLLVVVEEIGYVLRRQGDPAVVVRRRWRFALCVLSPLGGDHSGRQNGAQHNQEPHSQNNTDMWDGRLSSQHPEEGGKSEGGKKEGRGETHRLRHALQSWLETSHHSVQASVWEAPGGSKFHIRRAPAAGSVADCFPTVVQGIITETEGADQKCWTVIMWPPVTFPISQRIFAEECLRLHNLCDIKSNDGSTWLLF